MASSPGPVALPAIPEQRVSEKAVLPQGTLRNICDCQDWEDRHGVQARTPLSTQQYPEGSLAALWLSCLQPDREAGQRGQASQHGTQRGHCQVGTQGD